jgi:Uma2 family endonuclease
MATAAEPLLITVEQFRELPPREDVVRELRWGQVVTLTRPTMRHTRLQYRLVELLRPLAAAGGVVAAEVPFRALPEYDLRGADVAFVSRSRWDETPEDDNLHGSPELVVEVLSPSNTKQEMREKATLYLATGAEEFWIVDPARKTVTVMKRTGGTLVYEIGQVIPVFFCGSVLPVLDIFR